MRKKYATGGSLDVLAEDDEDSTEDADNGMPASAVTSAGGLNALDMPGAAEALALMARSSADARKALQQARESILARKYNRAIPLLAASAALGAPTRAGSTAESFGAMAGALTGPLREKQAFETGNQKELLGIDTSMAGLDQSTAQAQLQLAVLRAKLANEANNAPLEKVVVPGQTNPIGMRRTEARGKPLWVPPPGAGTNVTLNTQKDLYGTMATNLGEQYTNQYLAAQKAPQAIEATRQIRELLKKTPYTGTGAEWKLKVGKTAKALGFNYAGDDIKNTELLFSRLGQETLNNVKQSGLGTGNGFTEKDLRFLREVVGGTITLDNETFALLADLHENSARQSAKVWNDTYGRLNQEQLRGLGVTRIELPEAPDVMQPTVTTPSATESDEEPINPDDEAPARAPPAAETLLRSNPTPEMKQFFLGKYKYLPDGL
jgi:hypothetical protein